MSTSVGLADVRAAYKRIQGYVHRTPVFTCHAMDALAKRKLYFKAENMQKTGSFKARGACNAVFLEKERNPDCPGVVTHSSGNHGQAVAYAAKSAGLPCSVVVPRGTPKPKCNAIKEYGADLVFCDPTFTSRKDKCSKIAFDTGRVIIHPFDNYDVIAGQGTIAWELLEDVPDLDAILVPISGGGMTSGIAVAAREMSSKCRVYPVEPFGKELQPCLESKERLWRNPPKFIDTIADAIRTQQFSYAVCDPRSDDEVVVALQPQDAKMLGVGCALIGTGALRLDALPKLSAVTSALLQPPFYAVEPEGKELQKCLESRERLWPDHPQFLESVADSIRIRQLGFLTFPLVCEYAESKVFSVTDDQMIEGMRLSFERMKLVVEAASGAAVYSAVHSLKELDPSPTKVGVILCGGNVDLDHLPWISRKTSY